tara:strand:- start:408 stop:722 length:315 start_codon:yes stop_codon:yes gene_type:complete
MNKSLVIKNKLYLFLSFLFSFLLFLYLLYFLINGERGIISYYKIKNQQKEFQFNLQNLKNENDFFLDKIVRLQPNTIDLDFLEEQLRKNTGFTEKNEIILVFEE